MGPHQAAASARAGHVLQDRQPAAVLRSNTEAQAPEVDVARRRIHAQAGAVLPGRLRRGGPGVQALHGCAQGGPPSLRASSQSPAPLLAARPRLSRPRALPARCPGAPSSSAAPPCVPGSCHSWQAAWQLKSGLPESLLWRALQGLLVDFDCSQQQLLLRLSCPVLGSRLLSAWRSAGGHGGACKD